MWSFTRRTLVHADRHRIPFLASALTFDALLAAVPFLLIVLVGLTYAARLTPYTSATDIQALFLRFSPRPEDLPATPTPFAVVSRFLEGFVKNRGTVSLYAVPLFLWFSTRLFASVRTSLTMVYGGSVPPGPTNPIVAFLSGKARDIFMVLLTVVLIVVNTLLTAGLSVMDARGQELAGRWPGLAFFVTELGQMVTEAATFGFGIWLFYLVFRHASPRRLPRPAALAGSVFTALLFEAAKRGYAWYLRNVASAHPFGADANFGAAILFVGWVYYTALVFLLGAVVAETWDLRTRQRLADTASDHAVAR